MNEDFMDSTWTLERCNLCTHLITDVRLTLIRCGDGLFDSFRSETDKCSGDAFFVARDETTIGVGRGGDGGGRGVGLGSSNL